MIPPIYQPNILALYPLNNFQIFCEHLSHLSFSNPNKFQSMYQIIVLTKNQAFQKITKREEEKNPQERDLSAQRPGVHQQLINSPLPFPYILHYTKSFTHQSPQDFTILSTHHVIEAQRGWVGWGGVHTLNTGCACTLWAVLSAVPIRSFNP